MGGYNLLGKATKLVGFNYIDNSFNQNTDDIIDDIYYQCIKKYIDKYIYQRL